MNNQDEWIALFHGDKILASLNLSKLGCSHEDGPQIDEIGAHEHKTSTSCTWSQHCACAFVLGISKPPLNHPYWHKNMHTLVTYMHYQCTHIIKNAYVVKMCAHFKECVCASKNACVLLLHTWINKYFVHKCLSETCILMLFIPLEIFL